MGAPQRLDSPAPVSKPMQVPVGYVCLDILIGTTKGRPVHEPDCADDGLGA